MNSFIVRSSWMSRAVLWWVESVWVSLVAERGQEWMRPAGRDWSVASSRYCLWFGGGETKCG